MRPEPAVSGAAPGKRRAVRTESLHSRGRKRLFSALASAPSLTGLAVLVIAAVGAAVSQQEAVGASIALHGTAGTPRDIPEAASQESPASAADQAAATERLSGRARAVSRDSQREALQDAAEAELQAEAESRAKERNAALAALAASAERRASQIAANQWQLPLPARSYRLTSRFGECSYLWANCHTGLDLSAPSGTRISAVAPGVVTEVGYAGSYGYRTIIRLPGGTKMWYCHQTSYTVSVGQEVAAGELIGYVGSTGNSTGSHLHLEVHPAGRGAVDPLEVALARGLRF